MAEHKIQVVADKEFPTVTFNWDHQIRRDNENNPFICKGRPTYMAKIQRVKPAVTSGEKLLRDYASMLGVVVEDSDFEFRNPGTFQINAGPQPVAADTTATADVVKYAEALTNFLANAQKQGNKLTDELVTRNIAKIPGTPEFKDAVFKKVAPKMYERLHPVIVAPAQIFELGL